MLNSPRVLPPQLPGVLHALRGYLEPSADPAATIPALRARAHITDAVIRLENLGGTGDEDTARGPATAPAPAPARGVQTGNEDGVTELLTYAVEQLSEAVAAAVHAADILELAQARRSVQEALVLSAAPR